MSQADYQRERRDGFEYFNCTVVHETEKSRRLRIKFNGISAEYWVPKSFHQIRMSETGEPIAEIRTWFVEKEGIFGDQVN
jgi:hypothetical protein